MIGNAVYSHCGDVYDLSFAIVFIDRSSDRHAVAERQGVHR